MYIADLHIHSKYSRATSKDCTPESLELWARRKGIDIIGTGDFTHPAWRAELMEKLTPTGTGFYTLKEEYRIRDGITDDSKTPVFILSSEISSIYKKWDKVRKIHNLILLPDFKTAEQLSHRLEKIGNLHSDGRPILGLDSRDLLELTLDCCSNSMFIPAHIWTPHFSLFGAFSGFDRITDCFEDLTSHIHALETGLSSDPAMNWRISALDSYQLISNSDAHSPSKLGREANLLDISLSYEQLETAIQTGKGFAGTIEFFPEEGKYFLDGHRKCNLSLDPKETKEYNGICPVCGKKLTIGVLHRIEELADREAGFRLAQAKEFESLMPLPEVIASTLSCSSASPKVEVQYEHLLKTLGSEFSILREVPLEEIRHCGGEYLEEGIRRLRTGQVEKIAGFDGQYGTIQVFQRQETSSVYGQINLFDALALSKEETAAAAELEKQAIISPKKMTKSAKNKKLSSTFNSEQLLAVQSSQSVILVMAGPGTGKTKTLVERIRYLIEECETEPSAIMAVTFTNKAASQMKERLELELKKKRQVKELQIGTFHSICYEILTKLHGDLCLITAEMAINLIEPLLKSRELSCQPKKALQEISRYKNNVPLQGIIGEPLFSEIFEEYQSALQTFNLVDYDDLLRNTLSYLSSLPEDYTYPSYLLIDEFQDLNEIQYELIKCWLASGAHLFAIGDPNQAIYGFRGSSACYFEQIKQLYPAVQTISLVENYRSTPEILQCASFALKENHQRLAANRANGAPVRIISSESNLSQAIFIAKEINLMTGGMDLLDVDMTHSNRTSFLSFDEIAILYRTHQQAATLEYCLQKESIPYKVIGREDFLEDSKVKAALYFFDFLLHPKTITLFSQYLHELYDYSEEEMEKIIDLFPQEKMNPLSNSCLQRWELALVSCQISHSFLSMIRFFLPMIKKETPHTLLEHWREQHKLLDCEPLQKLIETAVFYSSTAVLLQSLVFGQEADLERTKEKTYRSGVVSLMTIHASKGLEFPAVFLCGLNKGIVPLEYKNRFTDIEEERRLFYVGITRAKEELILLHCKEKSIFLNDLPEQILQTVKRRKKKEKEHWEQLSFFL